MVLKGVLAATCGLALAGCVGVYGPKGNDTGGIIPWSPANETMAMQLAQENCGYYQKYAVIRTIHRVYGDWISYDCRFDPPGVPRGGRVVEDITVEPRPVGAPPPRRAARGPDTEPDLQIIR